MSEAWHDLRLNGDPNCRCSVAFTVITNDGQCIGSLERCPRHVDPNAPRQSPGLWLMRRFFYLYGFVASAMQVGWHIATWWRGA